MDPSSAFLFVQCQRGAEAALKRAVTASHPGLRPAYQRPGLVTFRSRASVTPDVQLDCPLARVFGVSLGTFADAQAAAQHVGTLPQPLRLHVSELDLYRPDEAPPAHDAAALAAAIETQLRAAVGGGFQAEVAASVGDLVLDVLVAPGDPLLLGLHRHTAGRSPLPGGRYDYVMPAAVPSRAYRKIEEAIAAFDLPLVAGDCALELGAAPGGAAYALLRRGVRVVGVDPGAMDPHVLAFEGPSAARLQHLQQPMAAIGKRDLPEQVDWLLLDVHLAPQVALRAASRFASLYRRTLLGAVLTLKLNDWAFLDDLPRFLRQAQELGLQKPRALQLPAHRQELCIAGCTALGERRRSAQRQAGARPGRGSD
ncbi:MAG TPA: SAM-dependent methyltransferase [Polyangiales bacterium]